MKHNLHHKSKSSEIRIRKQYIHTENRRISFQIAQPEMTGYNKIGRKEQRKSRYLNVFERQSYIFLKFLGWRSYCGSHNNGGDFPISER